MTNQATILIIEDDPTFRSLLVAILEDEGYGIVEEEDGKQALMALRRRSFDLVLSDLRLPGMEGLDLFRSAKAEGIAPPFVLLTAFGTVEEAVSALKEGVTDFLTKPLKDPDALRTLVRRTLENRRRELTLTVLRERETAGSAAGRGAVCRCGDGGGAPSDRECSGHPCLGPDQRRVGHRQGAGGADDPSCKPTP